MKKGGQGQNRGSCGKSVVWEQLKIGKSQGSKAKKGLKVSSEDKYKCGPPSTGTQKRGRPGYGTMGGKELWDS